MLHSIDIVRLQADGVPKAAELLAQYRHPDGWDRHQLEACERSLERLLQFPHAWMLLAERAGAYVGFISLNWGFTTSKGAPILHVQDVFTHPQHRRSGVARALLDAALQIAREHGAHRLQLETDTDNESARNLYDSLGFEHLPYKEVYMRFLSNERNLP